MTYIYALYNLKHKRIYIGQTEDLEERLKLRQSKSFKNSFTSKLDGKWELIYKEFCRDRKSALIREKQLKSYRGREFIKQFIPAWRNGSADPC